MSPWDNSMWRIIPTRVGTRLRKSAAFSRLKDHPHACGDKFACLYLFTVPIGSSPRVWGQVARNRCSSCVCRIIPTRVGTSYYIKHFDILPWDHPHACGDKTLGKATDTYHKGSSPRVWGQGIVARKIQFSARIIPTRVGTSFCNTCYS